MTKPIIATTFSGLFIKSDPWKKAHILWFQDAANELNDQSVNLWATKGDYFKGVDEIMKRLYPKLSDAQRTIKARELFFDSVCKYIEHYPEVKNENVINYFKTIRYRFKIALITTNTQEAINRILSLTDLNDIFDIIEASKPDEKDDKRLVFDRFIKNYGKPFVYIGGSRKDSFDYCKQHNIPAIFANLEKEEDIRGVDCVCDLEELKRKLDKLN